MSNALTKSAPKGAIATLSPEAFGEMEESLHDVGSGGGTGVLYANFSGKLGRYLVGREKADIDAEEVFFADPATMLKGWHCWKGPKPIAKVSWFMTNPREAVALEDLPDHSPYKLDRGEGWKRMVGIFAGSLASAKRGLQFTTDSVSGVNALSTLFAEIVDRGKAGEPYYPLFSFDKEQFTAQDQTNWKPKFIIHGWSTREQMMVYRAGVGYSTNDLIEGRQPTKGQLKKAA